MSLRDQIKAYVDGELSSAEMQEMEAAMKTDADLQAEVEMMRFLGTQLSSARVRFEPKGLDKVAGRFEKRRRWRMMPLAVAGMLAVGIIAWPMVRGGGIAGQTGPGFVVGGARPEGLGDPPAVIHSAEAGVEVPTTETDGGLRPAPIPSDLNVAGRGSFEGGASREKGRVQTNSAQTTTHWYSDAKPTRGEEISPASSAPTTAEAALNPLLIRTGSITIRVKSAQDAMNQAIGIAKSMGGYHEASHHSAGKGYDAQADVTIRIPVTRFDRALSALRELGEVTDDASNSQDVTAEIADVGARLKVMRAEEESYVTMLRAGRRVGEILEIKDRLSTVRQEIESLTAQQKALKNQSSYSTISCSFTQRPQAEPEPEPTNWIEDAWVNAANGAKSLGRAIATFGIFALSYAPFWLPVVLIGWFLSRRRAV